MRLHLAALFALFLLLFLLPVPPANAQSGSGEITGEVRDASGGLVAKARVTLTQVETGNTYQSASSDGGVYDFSRLKPGLYALAVEAAGGEPRFPTLAPPAWSNVRTET